MYRGSGMTERKMAFVVTTWAATPFKRDCHDCQAFAAAPPRDQENTNMLEALWFHMYNDHHIELHGDETVAKAMEKDSRYQAPYRRPLQ